MQAPDQAGAGPRGPVKGRMAATGRTAADRIRADLHDQAERAGHSIVSLTALAVITMVCVILAVGKELFLPLALGMLFAFILTPVVNALRRLGLGDKVAVVLTVIAAAVLVGAFVLVFAYQLSQIGANLPQYQGNVISKIDGLLDMGKDSGVVAHLQEMVADIGARLQPQEGTAADPSAMRVEVVNPSGLGDWLGVLLPALSPVVMFGLVAVVVVFALLERAALRDRLVLLIGGSNILATSRLLAEAGARVSTYLVAQLVVNIIYAVPIWLGLWLIGVPNALFFGIVTLILRFVPYLGTALSAILPLIMAFAVSPGWSMVLWTAALFLAVEFVTSNVIEPWFYGRRTGVSPLAVIVSAMFWTWLWGPMGLIIATPLTVCLVVVGHHVPGLRVFSILLGDNPVLEETARLYDRLLTGHAFAFDEATALAAGEAAADEIVGYYDRQAIPVLAMAQADHDAGLLTDRQAHSIAHAVFDLTERLEPVIEDEVSEEAETLPGAGRRVAVIGARTLLDDAAAELLAQAMRAKGAETLVLPHRAVPGPSLRDFGAETVVIAALDDAARPSTAVQMRQLRRRFPGLRLVLALWSAAGEAEAPEARLGADAVAAGMEQALVLAFDRPLEREG